MNRIYPITTLILAIALIAAFAYVVREKESCDNLGGTEPGGEMYASSTRWITSGAELSARAQYTIATTTSMPQSPILESITIVSSSPTEFSILNATSSTDIASTTIIRFMAGADEQTYDFGGIMFTRGIVIDLPNLFNGDVIFTWRGTTHVD